MSVPLFFELLKWNYIIYSTQLTLYYNKPELHLKESDNKMINLKITTAKNAISEEQQYFPENVCYYIYAGSGKIPKTVFLHTPIHCHTFQQFVPVIY